MNKDDINSLNIGAKIQLPTGEVAEVKSIDKAGEIITLNYAVQYIEPDVTTLLPPPPIGGLGAPLWGPASIKVVAASAASDTAPSTAQPRETTVVCKWSELASATKLT